MKPFLYEKSLAYRGHLIIPFVFGNVDRQPIYSYGLLSELGHRGKYHQIENPAGIYSNSITSLIEVAQEHLDQFSDVAVSQNLFQCRYTYQGDLVIIYNMEGKVFYDHYKADQLKNVAAPKLFTTEFECLNWIKQGLDQSHSAASQSPAKEH